MSNYERNDQVRVVKWNNQYPARVVEAWNGETLRVTDPDCDGLGTVEVMHPETGEAWAFFPQHLALVQRATPHTHSPAVSASDPPA